MRVLKSIKEKWFIASYRIRLAGLRKQTAAFDN